MRTLELKIPPGVVVLISVAFMCLFSRVGSDFDFELPARRAMVIALIALGAIISALGVVSFRRARTTVNPLRPGAASTLVVSGIYRWTRNPMYLGFLVGLLGWAIFLSNFLVLSFLPMFVLYLNRFQIVPEERALASIFGHAFTDYQSKVRRWL